MALVAASWFGVGVPAAFVTQIWAGSSFSPGQGGGFRELITWVVLFGVITLVAVAERHANTARDDLADIARTGAAVGAVVGVVTAGIWFSLQGGPHPGNWFVAPACACAGAILWLYTVRAMR